MSLDYEGGSKGIFVTFRYLHPQLREVTTDQMAFPGNINAFKRKFPNVAVVGYHMIDEEGVVTQACTMLNEKLPESITQQLDTQNALSGVITPEMAQHAVEAAKNKENTTETQGNVSQQVPPPPPVQQQPQQVVQQPIQLQQPPVQQQTQPQIFKDGDSYIKIVNGKVYRLKWVAYNDEKAEFDRKIRTAEDGKIEVTEWQELENGK